MTTGRALLVLRMDEQLVDPPSVEGDVANHRVAGFGHLDLVLAHEPLADEPQVVLRAVQWWQKGSQPVDCGQDPGVLRRCRPQPHRLAPVAPGRRSMCLTSR